MRPCPTGWGFASDFTVGLGNWPLRPVEDYLKKQRRFRHLTAENIQMIQEQRNSEWKLIRERWL